MRNGATEMVTKFRRGEYVKYSTNGVCLVEDINSTDFNPHAKGTIYYILRPISANSTTIFVPTDNELLVSKMRRILSKEEIDSAILSIYKDKIEWIDDKKERVNCFNEILKGDDPVQLLRMAGCIYVKREELVAKGKKLLSADASIFEQTEKLIENEFSFVLQIMPEKVSEYIKETLNNK